MNIDHFSQAVFAWLADVTLQATLILGLAGLILWLSPRISAARRHLLIMAALLTIPVLMIGSSLVPLWQPFGELMPTARLTLPSTHNIRTTFYPNGTRTEAAMPAPLAAPGMVERSLSLGLIASSLWLAGVGLGALALLRGALQLRSLRLTSEAESDPRLLQLFQETQRSLTIALPDEALRRSASCQVPMTWGWQQGLVLLPENARDWSDARLRLVLRHELAHIARGDVLATFFMTVSTLLVWFHPLAWLLWRSGSQACEQACDDIALQHTGSSREDFADELLAAVTELRGFHRCVLPLALAMAVSARARVLKNRLASILDDARARGPWPRSQRLLLLGGTLLSAFALSGLAACRTGSSRTHAHAEPQIQITSKVFEITTKSESTLLSDVGLLTSGAGVLQMIGIHDEQSAGKLIRTLNQKKGVDLMSAPSVTTRNKQKAQVEIVREFLYPTEFDPPSLPNIKDGKPIQLAPGQSIAVTPTTPTAFEMKPVGVRIEFEPEIVGDDTIDLRITPEITEFEGFRDYGSPIKASTVGTDGKIHESTLTENKIQQPIFHSRKISTSVTLSNRSTIIFGGLMGTDLQDVIEDGKARQDKFERHVFFMIQATVVKPKP